MNIKVILLIFITKIKTSHFIKNFTIVMSGTVVAQALGFLLSPVISRLYSPSDFGVFGSFNSLVGIIAAAATLEYSQALILPKKKEDAFYLFMIACLCTFSISIIFLIVYLIIPGYFKSLLQTKSYWILFPLIAAIIVSGLNQAFQAWCVRAKLFRHTSASQIIRSLAANSMQTGFGFVRGSSSALIWSALIADLFATINIARAAMRDFKGLVAGFSFKKMLVLAKDYKDFPIYSASMNVINSLSIGLPLFLLTHYFGLTVAGSYAFAIRILSMPMEFVLRALRQVLYQKASETHNDGRKLTPLYLKITGGLFALTIVPAIVFILWAPDIFEWVFGVKWYTAGEFARALVVWLMFMFCNLPATLFARIMRVQQKMFLYDVALLVLRTAALVIGGNLLSPTWTIMTFALVGAVMNVLFIAIIGLLLTGKEKVSGIDGLMKAAKGKL